MDSTHPIDPSRRTAATAENTTDPTTTTSTNADATTSAAVDARRPAGPGRTPPDFFVRDIDIRRAILAVLLRAECELRSDDVVERLWRDHGVDLTDRQQVSPRRRVSDTLRALERRGWCRRVRRGHYVAVPSAMSATRRWRCLNWRRPSVRFTR